MPNQQHGFQFLLKLFMLALIGVLFSIPSLSLMAQPWTQLGADIDGEVAGDQSGISVSLSDDGTRVAIGASSNDGSAVDAGHVRVYEYDGSNWSQLGSDIDGEAAEDYSGGAVAISGDGNRVIIGAYGNGDAGYFAGHARVYEYNGSAWVQMGSDLDGGGGSERYGTAVSIDIDGNRVAIGGDGYNGSTGRVRVFEYNGSTWNQVGMDIEGEAINDRSGGAVSLSDAGDRVIIGGGQNAGGGPSRGHARVYGYNGSAWVQLGSDLDGEADGDRFGEAVAISGDGNRIAIGSQYNGGNGANAGHVRAFEYNGSAWVQLGRDLDGNTSGYDRFGRALALDQDGSHLAVGCGAYTGTGSGFIQVLNYNGSSWDQIGRAHV